MEITVNNLSKKTSIENVEVAETFFKKLKGITEPQPKRKAITFSFYREALSRILNKTKANFVVQGSNYTDVEETVIKGLKRQHNVISQLGIDPKEEYGYEIIEPVVQLRKDGIIKIAYFLGLPEEICTRMPFTGPALATRIVGEITPERVELVRKATAITEDTLKDVDAFQYMAILHADKFTGIKKGKRHLGNQIEVRCWDSKDATTATPTELPWNLLHELGNRIPNEIPEVVNTTYNITDKPPVTMEAL